MVARASQTWALLLNLVEVGDGDFCTAALPKILDKPACFPHAAA